MEIEEIASEIQNSKDVVQSAMFMVDDAIKSFSALCDTLLVSALIEPLRHYRITICKKNEIAEHLLHVLPLAVSICFLTKI